MTVIRSRDNPRARRWAKLGRNARFRRTERRVVLEGPHLVAAALDAGLALHAVIASEEGMAVLEIASLIARSKVVPVVLSGSIFRGIVATETPQGIAAEIDLPDPSLPALARGQVVFLEGIQDAGNVGTIIRSAASFAAAAVVLDRGCADPWSPKALRAGMGGHFAVPVRLVSGLEAELQRFAGRLLCAVAHGGISLRSADLAGPIGWLFGSEGRGVSQALRDRAAVQVTISVSPGTESLNVAAAAAICLYEGFSRPGAGS